MADTEVIRLCSVPGSFHFVGHITSVKKLREGLYKHKHGFCCSETPASQCVLLLSVQQNSLGGSDHRKDLLRWFVLVCLLVSRSCNGSCGMQNILFISFNTNPFAVHVLILWTHFEL